MVDEIILGRVILAVAKELANDAVKHNPQSTLSYRDILRQWMDHPDNLKGSVRLIIERYREVFREVYPPLPRQRSLRNLGSRWKRY
jgi:hypothetical protein